MASISALIGLSDDTTHPLSKYPSILEDPRVNPDAYPSLAPAAKALKTDLRSAYADALAQKEAQERVQDRHFLDRAREYVELNEQVETSTALLTDLASFLSTFQRDLSAVSGHISELQGRSKTIEGRLAGRKAVEKNLQPLIHSIVLPPALITLIVDTEVSEEWVPAIVELNAKLGAIRSGPRIPSRKLLDDAAEALRVKASQKILLHFLSLLKPFTTSLTPSLHTLQSTHLLPLKPLFDFLWQHAARQAHEFQKAYVSTVRWHYETGFRRYVRALEKIRSRTGQAGEVIGNVVVGSQASLALLAKKNQVVSGAAGGAAPDEPSTSNPIDYSELAGPPVILAHLANDTTFRPAPEAIFRSLSIVLTDNSRTEYTFISTFFGSHSSLPALSPGPLSPTPFSLPLSSASIAERMSRDASSERLGDEGESESGRVSVVTLGSGKEGKEERAERLRRTVIEGVWRNVMEPALEYARSIVTALLDPLPSPISLLSMIRLNESLLSTHIDTPTCPPLESHLLFVRLSLWPAFAKTMNLQTESLHKMNVAATGGGGVWGGRGGVKDSVVQIVAVKYAELFNALVALSGEQDEEMVFSSVLRLRQELDKLLVNQAQKIADPAKQRAFLVTHYEELLQGLSAGLSTHPRSQTEVAHFRELARKLG